MKPSDLVPDDVGVIDNYAFYKSYDCFSNYGSSYCDVHTAMAESRLLMFRMTVQGGGGPPLPIALRFKGLPAHGPAEELVPLRMKAAPPGEETVVTPKPSASPENAAEPLVVDRVSATQPSATPGATTAATPKQLPPGKQQPLLAAGNPTSKTVEEVAKVKGTGNDRGTAHNQRMEEAYGAGGKAVKTQSGTRVHDAISTKPSLTDLRHEGKNYLRYIGIKGQKGGMPRQVPLSAEIRAQAIKDFQWIRAGKRAGIDRHVQWEFANAPPSPELERFLSRLRLSWVGWSK